MYGFYPTHGPLYYQPYFRSETESPRENAVLPKNVMYTTVVEPVFIDHLTKHKGQKICIVTSVSKHEGILNGVFIDHVTLMVEGKPQHIRLSKIVYFEKA